MKTIFIIMSLIYISIKHLTKNNQKVLTLYLIVFIDQIFVWPIYNYIFKTKTFS